MNNFRLINSSPQSLDNYLFKHAPEKISTEIDGESVIMDIQSGTYFSMNPVGSLIWSELQEESTFSSILESILDHFDVQQDVARKELVEFLDLLIAKGLLSVTKSSHLT